MNDVLIPSIGVGMEEAVLVRWVKQPGDSVAAGEVVAEIETDKATVELESPAEGRVGPHLVAQGDTVPVGEAVVRIYADGEGTAAPAAVPQVTAAQSAARPNGAPATTAVPG